MGLIESMLSYYIGATDFSSQLLTISLTLETKGLLSDQPLILQMPIWRPGRYEQQNFAQYVYSVKAFDGQGSEISITKKTKESWQIDFLGSEVITVTYEFYANNLDAGNGCFFDENQVYINPCTCLMFLQGMEESPCRLALDVPADYQVATGLRRLEDSTFEAPSYHVLADSPLIASHSILHHDFWVDSYHFHIWLQGECRPRFSSIQEDFSKFIQEEIQLFGSFPVSEYHFIYQVWPTAFHHGVEHYNSTVIAIGPGYDLFSHQQDPSIKKAGNINPVITDLYQEFLVVSAHELFHVWNVKAFRPKALVPYDYSREQSTKLHFITEGMTTYYQGLILLRSGVFSQEQFLKESSLYLNSYFNHYDQSSINLAQASIDTWLDGYKPSVNYRQPSIYIKGKVVAWILDLMIRKANPKKSLDDFLRYLHHNCQGTGYTDQEAMEELYLLTNEPESVQKLLFSADSLLPSFQELITTIGLELQIQKAKSFQSELGIKVRYENGQVISSIYPNSPAHEAGFRLDDVIIALNGWQVTKDSFEPLYDYLSGYQIEISFWRKNQLRTISITPDKTQNSFRKFTLRKVENPTPKQRENYIKWAGQELL